MISDEELCREWQHGSAGALEALVQRHHAPVIAHLSRLGADAHAAEDLAQETFLRLVREAHSYQYPRPFAPWLYTIARNLARNHVQTAYARRVSFVDVDDMSRPGAHEAADWLDRLEQRQGLRAAMVTLSFEQREVLSLRYGQDMSVEAVAEVLSIPVGTVKSRAFNALRRLRLVMDQTEVREAASEAREHG